MSPTRPLARAPVMAVTERRNPSQRAEGFAIKRRITKQTMAAMKATDAQRSELIEMIDLRRWARTGMAFKACAQEISHQ
jgi:hypothetical protein